jgi:trans-aconitate methyltransferase
MNAAHAPIVRAAQVLLDDRGGAVLDLGCGDGALLKKICTVSPGTSPYGLDLNAAAIMAAGQIMPHFAGNFHLGSLWDDSPLYKRHYSLVIVSLQRLDEVDISKAQVLLARLANCSEQILVYQYAESGKHVAMSERAARFGLDLYQPAGEERRVSWARVVTNAVYPT